MSGPKQTELRIKLEDAIAQVFRASDTELKLSMLANRLSTDNWERWGCSPRETMIHLLCREMIKRVTESL